MLKIGEFAQVGQVSIATLRHYDQYNLLKPSALDPDNGYRYYSLDQLPRVWFPVIVTGRVSAHRSQLINNVEGSL